MTAVSSVSAAMPTARLTTPIRVRPGVRATLSSASEVIPRGWCARRTAQHRRADRADRVGPGGQPGRRQAADDGHRDRDGHRQQRPPRRGVQAQRGRHRHRDGRGQQPGGQPDPGQLAQHGREQPGPAPADRGEHPQLAPPPAHRRGRGVADEQHAHHQDQGEQHHARLVHRVQDRHRHALFHPVLRQGQRRLPELARGQVDGHRRRRGAGHDVHVQAGALLDLLRDRVDRAPATAHPAR